MSDLISREALIKDAESWVAVNDYEKHLQKNVVEWLKEFPPAELSTNLAEVGTDCISRQAAIDALNEVVKDHSITDFDAIASILDLPPAQPEIVRCKDCKYAEYIDDVKTFWCTECGQGRTVAPNDYCSYAEREVNNEIN